MEPCLICVDLQRGFLDDPDLEPRAEAVLAGTAAWLHHFRERDLPVLHVRTTITPDGPALPHWNEAKRAQFAPGADAHSFASGAAPADDEPTFDKSHYSGFQSGELLRALREIGAEQAVIAGVHLHGCVRSTALDASVAGLRVSVATDATGSNDPPHAAATRRWLGDRGFRLTNLADWAAAAAPTPATEAGAPAERAAQAFPKWSALPTAKRVEALAPLGDILRAEAASLADAMAQSIRKPLAEGLAEVAYAAELADEALAACAEANRQALDARALRVPHGPVLLVTPWNNPIAIPVGKIVPALAYGNTAIWKPSPTAGPLSAALDGLLRRLDVPPGVLERVEGGADTAAALARSGRVRAVSLTGSLAAGRALQDLCAADLIPLQAELGGNNAAIVCADADLEEAASEIAAGAFSFAGQRCTATRRAIALDDIYEPLAAALRDRIEALEPGDPSHTEATFPPVVSASAASRLEALIRRADDAGADVWRPSWVETHRDTALVAPALVEGAPADSEIVREESFGPILVLQRASALDEAIERMNAVPQALAASIHTTAEESADLFERRASAGILRINRSAAGASASLPFGGAGRSQLGPPEHGPGDAEFYSRWQALYGTAPSNPGGRPPATVHAAAGGES